MTGSTALIVILAAIVLSVIIGTKTKTNVGIVALVFAFFIGILACGMKANDVVTLWPTRTFFLMSIVTIFYGYLTVNGTLKGISDRVIYASRSIPWALPLVLYLVGYIIAATGASVDALLIFMSAVAFGLAKEAGFSPVLAVMATYFGCIAGSQYPWGAGFATYKGIVAQTFDNDVAQHIVLSNLLVLFIIYTVYYLITFFVVKGYKVKEGITFTKPEPFTDVQKKSLALVAVVMLLIIVPSLLKTITGAAIWGKIVTICDIQVLSVLGIVFCNILKLGDGRSVLKNVVPWETIFMVCGMSSLISLAAKMGVIDFIGGWIGENVSAGLICGLLTLASALLSFVTNGPGVIFPMFVPMLPAIAAASGANPTAMCIAVLCGTCSTGLSPFSGGGSLALTGCKDEEIRSKLVRNQFLNALGVMALAVVLGFVGFFNIF